MRVWREAPIIEIHETVGSNGKIKKVRKRVGGSGLWHQVPAFWTAPTAARKRKGSRHDETAEYPQYVVPDDAVVIREGNQRYPVEARPACSRCTFVRRKTPARCSTKWTKPAMPTCGGAFWWPCPSAGSDRPPHHRQRAFGTLDAIEHASVDELSQIDGIGPVAESRSHMVHRGP